MKSFIVLSSIAMFLSASAAHAKLKIVATLPSLAAIAKEVGGDHVEVDVLASATEDPHFVEPKPSLLVKLNRADLLVQNGLDLESGWLSKLQTQARNPKILPGGSGFFDASRFVAPLRVVGRADRSMGDLHAGGNPHFLYDPRRGAKIAFALAEQMAALDPSIRTDVYARATALAKGLEDIAASARKQIDAVPAEKRRIVTYHRSLTYLIEWLGLDEVATLEPKPGVPPDPAHVASVVAKMKSTGARCLLQEEFYPKNTSRAVAEIVSGKLVVIDGSARFSTGETYPAHMKKIADGVVHALAP